MEGQDQEHKHTESLVYSREEYAKKEFWDDRFAESNGQFDWYANWAEIKPVFEEHVPKKGIQNGDLEILMVGCGNSKLSEEMAEKDGFSNITNMDISEVVLQKMREKTSTKESCKGFKYEAMDATNMRYDSDTFDVVIDKGTYDALACDPKDKKMIEKLYKEMLRVTKPGGSVVIITNGTPAKRMSDFEQFSEGTDVMITHK